MGDAFDPWDDDEHDQVVRLTDLGVVPGIAGAGTPYRYRRSLTHALLRVLRSVVVVAVLVVVGYRGLSTVELVVIGVLGVLGAAVYESYCYAVVQADRNGILLVGPLRVEAIWWEDVAWARPHLGQRATRTPLPWVLVRVDRTRTTLPVGFHSDELDRWRFELGGAPPRDHVPPGGHPPAPGR